MTTDTSQADTHIHLRARAEDKALIDRAARLMGVNRSQFLLAAGLKEAKNYLLDQSTIYADAETFNKILEWMDAPATDGETTGMRRLLNQKPLGERD